MLCSMLGTGRLQPDKTWTLPSSCSKSSENKKSLESIIQNFLWNINTFPNSVTLDGSESFTYKCSLSLVHGLVIKSPIRHMPFLFVKMQDDIKCDRSVAPRHLGSSAG